MEKYDLTTYAGLMRAVLDGKRLRFTYTDGTWWTEAEMRDGNLFARGSGFQEWVGGASLRVPSFFGTWSVVEPGPKPVDEMGIDALWAELDHPYGSVHDLREMVTEKREREARAAREKEIDEMTVDGLAAKFWEGRVCNLVPGCAILETIRSKQVCWTNGKTNEEARENLRVCLAALAKRKAG